MPQDLPSFLGGPLHRSFEGPRGARGFPNSPNVSVEKKDASPPPLKILTNHLAKKFYWCTTKKGIFFLASLKKKKIGKYIFSCLPDEAETICGLSPTTSNARIFASSFKEKNRYPVCGKRIRDVRRLIRFFFSQSGHYSKQLLCCFVIFREIEDCRPRH